jgi:hypothetical protein
MLPEKCRSELARDEFEGGAFFQAVRVIVYAHREQARSYSAGVRLSCEGGLTGREISGQGRRKFPSSCSGFHELVGDGLQG